MKQLDFYKMSGCGNDFIIIDNREKIVNGSNLPKFITSICLRKMSVGADGLILVENSDTVDFKWQFFNSDGSRAEMCGNGARCAARFAYVNEIAGTDMAFETDVGIIYAAVAGDRVKIKMTDPENLETDYEIELEKGPVSVSSINTGVPHVVTELDNIDDADDAEIVSLGREIRFHKHFAPAGANVNFISHVANDILIRTYERGVEDETLACGTGAVASAIVTARRLKTISPINLATRSRGILTVHYNEKHGQFYDIFLEGDARIIYKGELWEDSWTY
ncbi:MAG: diaminopimelate epimerase [Desulfobacteraceae bacterium]|nr:diaminopimelate epimerase [Desulfobacteraceae bacterium]